MKTKTNFRSASNSLAGGESTGRGKRLMPEKKQKNAQRAFYQEIEEDEEIDYLSFKRNVDSIEDYYDDDEEYLDDDEFDDELDDDEYFDDEEDDE